MTPTLQLLGSFFPPDMSMSYLLALLPLVSETLALVVGAITLAYAAGIVLALAVAVRLRGAALLVNALALVRAIPDLTLAILCVIAFGLGPGAGLIALFVYYTAATAKMFADLLVTAPRRPVEALEATGAGRLAVALYGLLPLTGQSLLTYGAFALECALRSSVIVGAVGGGGIGGELVGSLAGFDFRHATTQILLLVLVIAALDRAVAWLREHPRWLALLLPAGLIAAAAYLPRTFALHHALQTIGDMVPPTLDAAALAALPGLAWETIWMAGVGTVVAAVAGLLGAVLASHRLMPWGVRFPVRRLLELLRTIPEVVWGLVLVVIVGIGPLAGAAALALHSLGSLGRLFANELDAAPAGPQDAIVQAGGGRPAMLCYATIPLSLPAMAAHLLFRFDWNLRMATVLGLIGAGGIGQALYQAQQLFFYRQVLAYVLVTGVLVLVTDRISARLRRRLNNPRPAAHHCLDDVAGLAT